MFSTKQFVGTRRQTCLKIRPMIESFFWTKLFRWLGSTLWKRSSRISLYSTACWTTMKQKLCFYCSIDWILVKLGPKRQNKFWLTTIGGYPIFLKIDCNAFHSNDYPVKSQTTLLYSLVHRFSSIEFESTNQKYEDFQQNLITIVQKILQLYKADDWHFELHDQKTLRLVISSISTLLDSLTRYPDSDRQVLHEFRTL